MLNIYQYLIFCCIILLCSVNTAHGQQLNPGNLYTADQASFNPARVGEGERVSAFIKKKYTWSGIPGAPTLLAIGLNSSLAERKMGIGANVITDTRGLLNYLLINANYAYRTKFGEDHTLAMGVSAGIFNIELASYKIKSQTANDPVIFKEDKIFFATGVGFNYKFRDFSFAAASPELMYRGEFKPSVVVNTSYNIENERLKLAIEPMLLFHKNVSISYLDATILATWNKVFWTQFTYRTTKSYIFCAGVKVARIVIGFSYEHSNASIESIANGSKEIIIAFQ